MGKNTKLRRNQLDRFYQELKALNLKAPKLGWVKEVRESLGMSMQDLANRLGTIKQRVEKIEKDEVMGKTSLETLQKTAEALGCEFVYFIIPKTSLEKTLKEQAFHSAREILKQADKTMSLENQKTSRRAQEQMIETLAQEMLLKGDRKIWRKK